MSLDRFDDDTAILLASVASAYSASVCVRCSPKLLAECVVMTT